MPKPGEVYYLPPQEGDNVGPAKGDRPFVLLSLSSSADAAVTLAYCSTRHTEAVNGAAHLWLDPADAANRGSGLSRPTYVYPSRLGSYAPQALGAPAGRLIAALPAIRRELRFALGFGTGVYTHLDLPRGNRRGAVVALTHAFAAMTGYSYGVVITEPGYSRLRRQQTIVPVLPLGEFEPAALDLVVRGNPWVEALAWGADGVVLAINMVTTVFEPAFVAWYTDAVVDSDTMRNIDEALAVHFALALPTDT